MSATPPPHPPAVLGPSAPVYRLVSETSVLDWITLVTNVVIALATVGALVWAVASALRAWRDASREREERLAFDQRQQASRITAWERQWVQGPGGEPVSLLAAPFMNEDDAVVERRFVFVHNASDAPVYDMAVYYVDPGRPYERLETTWRHAVLPPSVEPRRYEVPLVPNCGALSEDVVLRVVFRDSDSRYWERDDLGVLHRREDLERLTPEQHQRRRMMEDEETDGVTWDPVPGDPDYDPTLTS
ncbi:hypothetical protein [uncultured Cellulomonas sp.]|uniref:hypothetical protein n=1 Tax=uncultured Cellulomonas sp. TaxID=189682 RepID=UPI002635216E|nr:hypothetical protein [uncultured Cellulomonas sp.]